MIIQLKKIYEIDMIFTVMDFFKKKKQSMQVDFCTVVKLIAA